MTNLFSIYIACVLLWFSAAFSLSAQPQPLSPSLFPSPATGHPDVDLFYAQWKRNTFTETFARLRYLSETLPVDTIFALYPEKGLTARDGTISTYEYFAHIRSTRWAKERLALVAEWRANVRDNHKNKSLDLLLEFLSGFYMADDHPSYEAKMEYYERVFRKARKAGNGHIETLVLREMFLSSFFSLQYARAFVYGQRLEEALERVDDGYLYKSSDYFHIGMAYYMFKDYDRALPLFDKSLACREVATEHASGVVLKVWNYLAIHHHQNGRLDSAAYYHRAILSGSEAATEDPVHLAIAISNLGRIEMERGDYDAAIAMLEAGLDYMKDDRDISFMAGVHTSLGACYLEKGDLTAAHEQMTAARSVMDQLIDVSRQKRLKDLCAFESRYYARLGRHDLARACQDSALEASARYEQLTGQHFIVLGQQQLQDNEIQLKSQQITRQRHLIVSILAVLTLILAGLALIVRLYRRRNAAYKALVRRSLYWADSDNELSEHAAQQDPTDDADAEVIEGDHPLFARLEGKMQSEKLYLQADMGIEKLACLMNVRRHLLSHAINSIAGKNINQYLNEYRIKETIRIINAHKNKALYIEGLYEQVGFSSRTSFYRVFKQFTGLSPLEFKKNL